MKIIINKINQSSDLGWSIVVMLEATWLTRANLGLTERIGVWTECDFLDGEFAPPSFPHLIDLTLSHSIIF